jgi:carbon storage regulator CsrA
MLVLTRKPGEKVVITTPEGRVIEVTMRNDKLAIEAPREVRILRGELLKEVKS